MQNSNWFRRLVAAPGRLLGGAQQTRLLAPNVGAKEDEPSFESGTASSTDAPALGVDRLSHGVTREETLLLDQHKQSKQLEKARTLCAEIVERYRVAEDQKGLMWFVAGRVVPLYRSMGLLEEAIVMQRQVVEWERPCADEKHSGYVYCLTTLAELYEEMGQYVEALAYYRSVLEIRERNYDPNRRVCIDAFGAGVGMSYNPDIGDRLKARADVDRCISKIPGYPPALHPPL